MRSGIDCKGRKYTETNLPKRANDLTNMTFGRLKALFPVYNDKNILMWLCVCQCGNSDLVSKNNGYLRYDFVIFQDNHIVRLIEFDGPQHQRPYDGFGGVESFLIQQENDTLKNEYELSHNIPLVRIPYSKRDSMTIDDLLGNQYLIKE